MFRNLSSEAQSSGGLLEGCKRHERKLTSLKQADADDIAEAFRLHGERRFLDASAFASS